MITRSYSEMIQLHSFEERFEYLRLNGVVGKDTFGWNRCLNQVLYNSRDWKSFRNRIIIRDLGCDLAMEGYEICKGDPIYIHHINPISIEDVLNRTSVLFDPDNAICTKFSTHNAIHYGDSSLLIKAPIERTKNDTCPWRQNNKKE